MSSMRWTQERYDEWLRQRHATPAPRVTAPQPSESSAAPETKKPKYRNKPTHVDGIRFDSKIEADRYVLLRGLWKCGHVLWFVRQVPFDLPGGRKYKADFVVMYASGQTDANGEKLARPVVEDCKGIDTPMSKLKRDQVADLYGIHVVLIKRADMQVRAA